MDSNEIQSDLEKRKKQITEVSAYSSLRFAINLLCSLFIIIAILVLSISLITTLRESNTVAPILSIMLSFLIAALIIYIFLVIRDLALAFVDSVDLQLLSNRRSELNRKED